MALPLMLGLMALKMGGVLLSVDVSAGRSLTLLWHTTETLERKRSRSIASSKDSRASVSLHHTLHHSLQKVVHWICASISTSRLTESLSKEIINALSLEHLSK